MQVAANTLTEAISILCKPNIYIQMDKDRISKRFFLRNIKAQRHEDEVKANAES